MKHENEVMTITGDKGEGKSTLAFHYARRRNRGIAIFSPVANFTNGAMCAEPESLELCMDNGISPVIYRSLREPQKDFENFAEVILRRKKFSVIVDEAWLLCGPQWVNEHFGRVLRNARFHEISMYLTAHRPQDLHDSCYVLADFYGYFRTTTPLSLRKIADFTSPELEEKVQTLPKHVYALWDKRERKFFINTDPKSWFVEIEPDLSEAGPDEFQAQENGPGLVQ